MDPRIDAEAVDLAIRMYEAMRPAFKVIRKFIKRVRRINPGWYDANVRSCANSATGPRKRKHGRQTRTPRRNR